MKKFCQNCGAPQPENVQFELGQKQDLIKNTEVAGAAAKGPDIHCPFCGTRNPADAKNCSQCGGNLEGGTRRITGQVLSAAPLPNNEAIICPACGTSNPAGSVTCSSCGNSLAKQNAPVPIQSGQNNPPGKGAPPFRPWMLLPLAALLLLCCFAIWFLFLRTSSLSGTVQKTEWQRSIAIESLQQVVHEAWQDQLPADAKVMSCQLEYRRTQDDPVTGAKEVCTTALVDQGNGAGKVEETCKYEVYDNYCKYQVLEWQKFDEVSAQGTDLNPYWPNPTLGTDQREGERSQNYLVYFETQEGVKKYTLTDGTEFLQYSPGSTWNLSVNSLGAVVTVSR